MAKYLYQVLTNISFFKRKQYEQALIETFLKLDEILKLGNVNSLLKNYTLNRIYVDLQFEFVNFSLINNRNSFFIQKNSFDSLQKKNNSYSANSSNNSSFQNLNFTNMDENNKSPEIDHIEAFVEKRESIKENNEFLVKKNKSRLSSNSEENNTIYSFGGIIVQDSNQVLIKDLACLYTGTTANVILIKKQHFYIANVGDSLAVLYKNGKAIRLNVEHKLTVPGEKNRVQNAGMRIINNRIEGKLNLTRAIGILKLILGDFVFKNNQNLKNYEQGVIAYPEVSKFKITPDMEFIIMACDGVWDCVEVQQFCDHISMKLKENLPISKIIGELFDQILSKTNRSIFKLNKRISVLIICLVSSYNFQRINNIYYDNVIYLYLNPILKLKDPLTF